MTLRLPDWLPPAVVMCVAGHFPLGDEDAERRAADAWSDKAEWCREQAEYYEAKAKPPEGSHGDTVAAIADKYRRTADRFRQQATNCDSLARQLYESANATELQKMVIISMAVILAIQLARCALMFAAGGPIQAAIAQMATRTAAQRAWMRFVAFLSGRGAELAAERGSMVLLRNGVVMGVALGGGTQAGAQAVQVAKGDREQMDWTSVGVATAAGAVGGLFGMLFGLWAGPKVATIGANANSTAGRVALQLAGTTMVGAGAGAVGALGGTAVSLVLSDQPFSRKAFTEGLIPGMGSGFIGAAGFAAQGMRSRAPLPDTTAAPAASPDVTTAEASPGALVDALRSHGIVTADFDPNNPSPAHQQQQIDNLVALLSRTGATADGPARPALPLNSADWQPSNLPNALVDNLNPVKSVKPPSDMDAAPADPAPARTTPDSDAGNRPPEVSPSKEYKPRPEQPFSVPNNSMDWEPTGVPGVLVDNVNPVKNVTFPTAAIAPTVNPVGVPSIGTVLAPAEAPALRNSPAAQTDSEVDGAAKAPADGELPPAPHDSDNSTAENAGTARQTTEHDHPAAGPDHSVRPHPTDTGEGSARPADVAPGSAHGDRVGSGKTSAAPHSTPEHAGVPDNAAATARPHPGVRDTAGEGPAGRGRAVADARGDDPAAERGRAVVDARGDDPAAGPSSSVRQRGVAADEESGPRPVTADPHDASARQNTTVPAAEGQGAQRVPDVATGPVPAVSELVPAAAHKDSADGLSSDHDVSPGMTITTDLSPAPQRGDSGPRSPGGDRLVDAAGQQRQTVQPSGGPPRPAAGVQPGTPAAGGSPAAAGGNRPPRVSAPKNAAAERPPSVEPVEGARGPADDGHPPSGSATAHATDNDNRNTPPSVAEQESEHGRTADSTTGDETARATHPDEANAPEQALPADEGANGQQTKSRPDAVDEARPSQPKPGESDTSGDDVPGGRAGDDGASEQQAKTKSDTPDDAGAPPAESEHARVQNDSDGQPTARDEDPAADARAKARAEVEQRIAAERQQNELVREHHRQRVEAAAEREQAAHAELKRQEKAVRVAEEHERATRLDLGDKMRDLFGRGTAEDRVAVEAARAAREQLRQARTKLAECQDAYDAAVAQHDAAAQARARDLVEISDNAGVSLMNDYEAGVLTDRGAVFDVVAQERVRAALDAGRAIGALREPGSTADGTSPMANASPESLVDTMVRGSRDDRVAAMTEWIRRGDDRHRLVRETQAAAFLLLEHGPVDMKTGEGKTIVMVMKKVSDAIDHGTAHAWTSSDLLAGELAGELQAFVARPEADTGIDVVRMDQDGPLPDPVPGRSRIVVGTKEDYLFRALKVADSMMNELAASGMSHQEVTALRDFLNMKPSIDLIKERLDTAASDHGLDLRYDPFPAGKLTVDEFDTIFDGNSECVLSPGAAKEATPEVVAELQGIWNRLTTAEREHGLTAADFKRPENTRGMWAAETTPAAVAKLEKVAGGPVTDSELKLYADAANARWGLEKGTHYITRADEGEGAKIGILAHETNDKAMWDRTKSTEVRWQDVGQFVDLKEGLPVRANQEHSLRMSDQQLIGSTLLFEPSGLSGTMKGVEGITYDLYGVGPVPELPTFYTSQRVVEPPKFYENTHAKLTQLARDIVLDAHVVDGEQTGRAQWVVCMDNGEIRGDPDAGRIGLIDLLRAAAKEEHGEGFELKFEVVDAEFYAEHGGSNADAEALVRQKIAEFGDKGTIYITNKDGGRGADPTPSQEVIDLGGVDVKVSGGPSYSERVNDQVDGRGARGGSGDDREHGGTPGSAVHYVSPEDFLGRVTDHGVTQQIVQYTEAVKAHRAAQEQHEALGTEATRSELDKTETALRNSESDLWKHAVPAMKDAVEQNQLASKYASANQANAPPTDAHGTATQQPQHPPPRSAGTAAPHATPHAPAATHNDTPVPTAAGLAAGAASNLASGNPPVAPNLRDEHGDSTLRHLLRVLDAPGGQAAAPLLPVAQAVRDAAFDQVESQGIPIGADAADHVRETARNLLNTSLNQLDPAQRQLVTDAGTVLQQGRRLEDAHTAAVAQLVAQVPTAQPVLAAAAGTTVPFDQLPPGDRTETLQRAQQGDRSAAHALDHHFGPATAQAMCAVLGGDAEHGTPPTRIQLLAHAVARATLGAAEAGGWQVPPGVDIGDWLLSRARNTWLDSLNHLNPAVRRLVNEALDPRSRSDDLTDAQVALFGWVAQEIAGRAADSTARQRKPSAENRDRANSARTAEADRKIKQAIARQLFETFDIEVLGLDKPGISVDTALSIRNAIVDGFAAGQELELDVVLVAPMVGNTGACIWTPGGIEKDAPTFMVLNENLFGDREKFRNTMRKAVQAGRLMAPTGDPAYDAVSHEMGHLQDRAARKGLYDEKPIAHLRDGAVQGKDYEDSKEARAFGFLYTHFAEFKKAGMLPPDLDFDDWLGQLDSYSSSRKKLKEAEEYNRTLAGDESQGTEMGTSEPKMGDLAVFNPAEALAEANNAFGRTAPADRTHPAYVLQALLRDIPYFQVLREAEQRNALVQADYRGPVPAASEFGTSIASHGPSASLAARWRAMSPTARANYAEQQIAYLNPDTGFVLDELARLQAEHRATVASTPDRTAQTPDPRAPQSNSSRTAAPGRPDGRSAFPPEFWQQHSRSHARAAVPAPIHLGAPDDAQPDPTQPVPDLPRSAQAARRAAFDSFRRQILAIYVAGPSIERSDAVARALADADPEDLRRALREAGLDPNQQRVLRQFWPGQSDRTAAAVLPAPDEDMDPLLWAPIRKFASAVARVRASRESPARVVPESDRTESDAPIPDRGGLTPRELEVLRLSARGLSYPEIGPLMGISHKTVQSYARHACAKLRCPSVIPAVLAADREGWLDEPSGPHIDVEFSPDEVAILQLAANGLDNRDIAAELGTTRYRVRTFMAALPDRLGVEGRLPGLLAAQRQGAFRPGDPHSAATRKHVDLSPREREALDLVAAGLTDQAIGDRLGVTASTARGYRIHLQAKLGTADHEELAALARSLESSAATARTVELSESEALLLHLVTKGVPHETLATALGLPDSGLDPVLAQLADKIGTRGTIRVPAQRQEPTSQLERLEALAGSLPGTSRDPATVSWATVRAFRSRIATHPSELTGREPEVLRLAAQGLSLKAIARTLGGSHATVINELDSIAVKLGTPDRAVLMTAAQRAWSADHPEPIPEPPVDVSLTPQETEILRLVARKFSNPDIAAQLDISVPLVKHIRRGLRAKLGINDTAGLIAWALHSGIAVDDPADAPDPELQARVTNALRRATATDTDNDPYESTPDSQEASPALADIDGSGETQSAQPAEAASDPAQTALAEHLGLPPGAVTRGAVRLALALVAEQTQAMPAAVTGIDGQALSRWIRSQLELHADQEAATREGALAELERRDGEEPGLRDAADTQADPLDQNGFDNRRRTLDQELRALLGLQDLSPPQSMTTGEVLAELYWITSLTDSPELEDLVVASETFLSATLEPLAAVPLDTVQIHTLRDQLAQQVGVADDELTRTHAEVLAADQTVAPQTRRLAERYLTLRPSQTEQKPTRADIARLAGVGESYVSSVFNGRFGVKKPWHGRTTQCVLAAAYRLGVSPDRAEIAALTDPDFVRRRVRPARWVGDEFVPARIKPQPSRETLAEAAGTAKATVRDAVKGSGTHDDMRLVRSAAAEIGFWYHPDGPMGTVDAITLSEGEFYVLRLIADGIAEDSLAAVLGMTPDQSNRLLVRLAERVGVEGPVRMPTDVRSSGLPDGAVPSSSKQTGLSPQQVQTLRLVVADLPYTPITGTVPADTVQAFRSTLAERHPTALTGREREVLALLAEGLTSGQIAARLGLSRNTVNGYIARAEIKLHTDGLRPTVQAAQQAEQSQAASEQHPTSDREATSSTRIDPVAIDLGDSDARDPESVESRAGRHGVTEKASAATRTPADVAAALRNSLPGAVKQVLDQIDVELRSMTDAERRDAATRADLTRLPGWVVDRLAHEAKAQELARDTTTPEQRVEWRLRAERFEHELANILGLPEPGTGWTDRISSDPLHHLRALTRRPDASAELRHLVDTATRCLSLQDIAAAVEPLHRALADWPMAEHTDRAAAIAWELALQARADGGATPEISAAIHGQPGQRWIEIHVSDDSRTLPARESGDRPGWRAVDLLDTHTETWGWVLPRDSGRQVWFKLFETADTSDPSQPPHELILDLPIPQDSLRQGPGLARRAVRRRLRQAGHPDPYDLTVLVSDLVQNVYRYADQGDARVRIRLDGDTIRIGITDTSRGLPARQQATTQGTVSAAAFTDDQAAEWAETGIVADTHGFFLGMLEAMASAWGVILERAGGKTIWFEVPMPPPTPGNRIDPVALALHPDEPETPESTASTHRAPTDPNEYDPAPLPTTRELVADPGKLKTLRQEVDALRRQVLELSNGRADLSSAAAVDRLLGSLLQLEREGKLNPRQARALALVEEYRERSGLLDDAERVRGQYREHKANAARRTDQPEDARPTTSRGPDPVAIDLDPDEPDTPNPATPAESEAPNTTSTPDASADIRTRIAELGTLRYEVDRLAYELAQATKEVAAERLRTENELLHRVGLPIPERPAPQAWSVARCEAELIVLRAAVQQARSEPADPSALDRIQRREEEVRRLTEPLERYRNALQKMQTMSEELHKPMALAYFKDRSADDARFGVEIYQASPHVALKRNRGTYNTLIVAASRGRHAQVLREFVQNHPQFQDVYPPRRRFKTEFVELIPKPDGTVYHLMLYERPGDSHDPQLDELRYNEPAAALLEAYMRASFLKLLGGAAFPEWLADLGPEAFYQPDEIRHRSFQVGELKGDDVVAIGQRLAERERIWYDQSLEQAIVSLAEEQGPLTAREVARSLATREWTVASTRYSPQPGRITASSMTEIIVGGMRITVPMAKDATGRWVIAEPRGSDGLGTENIVAYWFSQLSARTSKGLLSKVTKALIAGSTAFATPRAASAELTPRPDDGWDERFAREIAASEKPIAAQSRTPDDVDPGEARGPDPVAIDLDADGSPPADRQTDNAETHDNEQLRTLRAAVAARLAGTDGVSHDPVLNHAPALIDELMAARRRPDAQVPSERLRLLEQFAHQMSAWLACADEATEANAAYEQGLREGTPAVLRARQDAAEIRLGSALAAVAEVWTQTRPRTDTPIVTRPADHLGPGETERLRDVAETIFGEMVAAGAAVDAVSTTDRRHLAEDTRRYDALRDMSQWLEELLTFAEQWDTARIGRERLSFLLDHFRATSELLAATEIRDTVAAALAGATDRERRLAQAAENYGVADRAVRNIAEMLGEPQNRATATPPAAQPGAPVVWPGANGQPDFIAQARPRQHDLTEPGPGESASPHRTPEDRAAQPGSEYPPGPRVEEPRGSEETAPRRYVEANLTVEDLGSVAAASDRGRHAHNEDAFALIRVNVGGEEATALIVNDGLSRPKGGHRASAAAKAAAHDSVVAALRRADRDGRIDPVAVVEGAVAAAQEAVLALPPESPADKPPATTIVVALLESGRLTVDWVGDSRAYWIPLDGGPPIQLTRDDSKVQDVLDVFEDTTREEAEHSPIGGPGLTHNLGRSLDGLKPREKSRDIRGDGVILALTDGVWEPISPDDPEPVAAIVRRSLAEAPGDLGAVTRALVRAGIEAGTADDVTAAAGFLSAANIDTPANTATDHDEPATPADRGDDPVAIDLDPDEADPTPVGSRQPETTPPRNSPDHDGAQPVPHDENTTHEANTAGRVGTPWGSAPDTVAIDLGDPNEPDTPAEQSAQGTATPGATPWARPAQSETPPGTAALDVSVPRPRPLPHRVQEAGVRMGDDAESMYRTSIEQFGPGQLPDRPKYAEPSDTKRPPARTPWQPSESPSTARPDPAASEPRTDGWTPWKDRASLAEAARNAGSTRKDVVPHARPGLQAPPPTARMTPPTRSTTSDTQPTSTADRVDPVAIDLGDPDGPAGNEDVGGDAVSRLSPAEVGVWLRDELRRLTGKPDVEVHDFDRPDLDPETIREIARALVDMATQHPQVDIGSIAIGELSSRVGASTMSKTNPITGYVATEWMTFNADFAVSKEKLHRWMQDRIASGKAHPSMADRPAYAIVVHEFGHMLDYAGRQEARYRAEETLFDHYKAKRLGERTYAAFTAWLHRYLTVYSFDKKGQFNPTEALAEAFVDVVLNGRDSVSEPVGLLYDLLVNSVAAPRTTADSDEVDHSPAPEPQQEVTQVIGQMRDLESALGQLADSAGMVDPAVLFRTRAELDALVDERLAARPDAARRHDQTIATLRDLTSRSDVAESDVRTLAEIVPMKRSRMSGLLPGANDRYIQALRAAARSLLADLDADRPSRWAVDSAVSEFFHDLRAAVDDVSRKLYSGRTSEWTVQRLLDNSRSMLSTAEAARRAITDAWRRIPEDRLLPLLSEIARGRLSRDDFIDAVIARLPAPLGVSGVVREALRRAENAVLRSYTEAAVRGYVFGEQDARTITAFEEAAAGVRAAVGLSATGRDLSAEVRDAVAIRPTSPNTAHPSTPTGTTSGNSADPVAIDLGDNEHEPESPIDNAGPDTHRSEPGTPGDPERQPRADGGATPGRPGDVPPDQLRRQLEQLVAQRRTEQAVVLLRDTFAHNVFPWIQANLRSPRVAREVFDEACAHAVGQFGRIGRRDIEEWVVLNARNLMAQHREVAEIWQRIQDFVVRGARLRASDPLATVLAEADTVQVRQHMRALTPIQQQALRRFASRRSGPDARSVMPGDPAAEPLSLWHAVCELATAVADEGGVQASLPDTPRPQRAKPSSTPGPTAAPLADPGNTPPTSHSRSKSADNAAALPDIPAEATAAELVVALARNANARYLPPIVREALKTDRQALQGCIEQLAPSQQRILQLRFGLEMSPDRTADWLDRSPGAVRTAQHATFARLARLLQEHAGNQALAVVEEAQEQDPDAFHRCLAALGEKQRAVIRGRLVLGHAGPKLAEAHGRDHRNTFYRGIQRLSALLLGDAQARPGAEADRELVQQTTQEALILALPGLTNATHRQTLILRFVRSLPRAEAAEAAGVGSHAFEMREFRAIRAVAELLRTTTDAPATTELPPRPVVLSDRETEILRMLLADMYFTEIAAALAITPAAVHTHAQHIYRKLRVGNRAQLAQAARSAGIDLRFPDEQPDASDNAETAGAD
ncbi:LuxR C-terminal-related transcriptional regulator [Nocardia abscessus]|uniref:LuxR C-terminal-related transcriptional regulator n=1 Tax=Nocardia abscessus TaxID=120957 RepID=UPI002458EABA|nr:LuxR C-terminal-related transcriptional regulator [Nocardia abscessus]